MFKRIWIALGAFVVTVAAAGAAEPPWSIEGRFINADNCAVVCPCLFGEEPTHGHCHFIAVVHVDEGHFGDVDLAGTSFGFAGVFRRPNPPEFDFSFLAYYPDANASETQRSALESLLTETEMFSGLGEPAELSEQPITWSRLEDFARPGRTTAVSVGEIARIETTPIAGATDPDEPLVIENPADPFAYWVALGTASNSFYHAATQDMSFEGTSGEDGKVRWSGGGQ